MSNKNKIIKAMFVAFAIAVALPVLFGHPASFPDRVGGDDIRNLIYDFQTLIGGALAVGAAWWTVQTMESTEAASERRHSEQLEIVRRADRLTLERAINPQLTGLTGMGFYFNYLTKEMLRQNTYKNQLHYAIGHAVTLRMLAKDIFELLDRDQLRDGSRLFNGDLAYRLHWLRQQASILENALSGLGDEMRFVNADTVLNDFDARWKVDPAYGAILRLNDGIAAVVDLMSKAAADNGIATGNVADPGLAADM